MDDNYIYPAKVQICNEHYEITFIDFPDVITAEGNTMQDAICNAQRILALTIEDYLSEKKELPVPTDSELNVIYIHIWLPYFNYRKKEEYVRKNVTIPKWLDTLASSQNVNFSATLVKGLKAELGIKN